MIQRQALTGAILLSITAAPAAAQSYGACQAPQPLVTVPSNPISDMMPGAIGVRSDRSEISDVTAIASFFGNVQVQFDERQLFTDAAEINRQTGSISASGSTSFSNGYVYVISDNFNLDTEADKAELSGARYQMSETGARGQADLLELTPASLDLYGSTFTTCPEETPAWQLSASEISINEDDSWGEAWHAKFELFGLPVFYLPYISFPTTDARKSGMLFPTFRSSSTNGFEVEVPYYFNIAPNYDATLTPRYMAERGLQTQVELRYLTDANEGQFNIEYLPEDSSLASEPSRLLWHIENDFSLNENWRGYVNGTYISDDDYLNDFGSDFAGRADSHLYRHAQLDYVTEHGHSRLRVEDFDLLGQYRSPYRTLPQFSSDYVWQNGRFDYGVYGELTHFRNQDLNSDYSTRLHVEPTASYHVEYPAYDWLAELGYAYTTYKQISPNPELDERVTRALPNFRWRGRLNFERDFTWGNANYTQTLQPQVQYLYVPYEDQSNIGIYDTTLMQDDYNGLFRARRYSGLDRIADANQVTLGASSSFFNDDAEEILRLSLGQIYYLEDSRTSLFADEEFITSSNSDIAAEFSFQMADRWSFSSAIQYDAELKSTQKSQTALEYRKDSYNLVQFSHRLATNLLNEDIEQVGMQGAWELNPRWQVAANWYYDLNNRRSNDAMLGVQYSSCCWAVRVSGYRRINRNLEIFQPNQFAGQPEFDNGISIQFIIKGLGSDNNSLIDMLEEGLFGYRRPFYLSN